MKRRDFVKVLGVSSILLATPIGCIGGSDKKVKNWVWLRVGGKMSDEELYDFLKDLKSHNIHGVLPSGGNGLYKRMAPMCKKLGLDFHAWRWTMNRGGYMKDKPHLYAVSRNGDSVIDKPPYVGYYRWLCPSQPEVEKILIDDYTELCDIDGLNGVHLDYVRYCDVILPKALQPKYNLVQDHEMPEYDFCYCELCRSKFKKEHGIDPMDIKDPENHSEWRQWRLDQLVKLINKVADAVHKKGKKISAAVFPTPTIARKIVRQDWERFNLDMYMPMIYFKDYYGDLKWVEDIVKEDVRVVGDKADIFAGLHLGHIRQEFGLEKVVKTCLDSGAKGVSFFLGEHFKEDEWKRFDKIIETFKKS